jgi:hypothetical protein
MFGLVQNKYNGNNTKENNIIPFNKPLKLPN